LADPSRNATHWQSDYTAKLNSKPKQQTHSAY